MTTRALFPTLLYDAEFDDAALLADLAHSIRTLAQDDGAGRRWSLDHGYRGYTSYASLDDLPRRDPAFADLAKLLVKHAATFAAELAFDLPRKPKLDSLWVNLLKSGGQHSGHIHPHSILSGTLYVEVPDNAGAIRRDDTVARIGGEEFAVLFSNSSIPNALMICERIRQEMAQSSVEVGGQAIRVTVSGGVAILCEEGIERALKQADQALYAAKRGGRDQMALAA